MVKRLSIFVILLLVIGVSSMAASFYCSPRYINEEYHHYNSGICDTVYNEETYPTDVKYDDYYYNRGRGCGCSSGRFYNYHHEVNAPCGWN
ncbi:hypothetical protein PKF05_05110 [Fusobacterium simiae]|uniref:Uncharacterized protein n=1 Tax=Fusobacterium simiae TaxID=855 RepID=A0ABT4DKF1_FUSSI|nr:hypothetical protein [Fusobacterium simiae]MCY7009085.1 hypothetical protein [Fusobacterium simiae]MDC7955215.1 hypothetical protein [Fusobacterium simiae]